MAKRIKVKGKTPRGLSKAQRRILNASSKVAEAGSTLTRDFNKNWSNTKEQMEKAGKDVSSRPSSTRKKMGKEGSRKFIGPRTQKSEGRQAASAVDKLLGEFSWQAWRRGKKKLRAPDQRRMAEMADIDDGPFGSPTYGDGSIGSKRLKELLYRLEQKSRMD